jgi:acetyltransferase-like isoleucine patch superfamily enzyme
MNQKERMLSELPYKAWLDGLTEERLAAKRLCYRYNTIDPDDTELKNTLIRQIIGKTGSTINIEPPFHCDYGKNIETGNNFYANFNLIILDVAKVTIGDNVMCGPNVSIITAGHPIHFESRNSGYEYGISIKIGHNVWLGSNVVVNPGVTIGENSVIGSGAVVTKDIPPNVIAAGTPCKVLRQITDGDRKYYYKNREFDVSDY